MRALTVRQPWAGLIAGGIKDVENRSWRPPADLIGADFAIHAGQGVDRGGPWLAEAARVTSVRGAVIAVVGLVDVVDDSPSTWALTDCWHWLLGDVRLVDPPVPAIGRLGLWTWASLDESLRS